MVFTVKTLKNEKQELGGVVGGEKFADKKQ